MRIPQLLLLILCLAVSEASVARIFGRRSGGQNFLPALEPVKTTPQGTRVAPTRRMNYVSVEPTPFIKKGKPLGSSFLTLDTKALSAKQAADKLEQKLNVQKQDPRVLAEMKYPSTAYQRFRQAYTPSLPKSLESTDAILARMNLEKSPRGSWIASKPRDQFRPGVVIVSDEAGYKETDDVVARLRDATTEALKGEERNLRANSIVVALAGENLAKGLALAKSHLASIPDYVAANAAIRARDQAGNGRRRSAGQRVDRAASGGIGRRRFEGGLDGGLSTAIHGVQQGLEETAQVISLRAKQAAYEGAARVERRAMEVKKPVELVGFEVDFYNQRPKGVEYTIKTSDGRDFYIKNLGKNFSDPAGSFVPASVYGPFNVAVLKHYEERGPLSNSELQKIATKHGFSLRDSGELVYSLLSR